MVSYEYFIYNVKLLRLKKLPHPIGTAVMKIYFTIE